jgi:small redox-active disulfide protein 2
MLSIKVLGPGCPNCERVEQHVMRAMELWSAEEPKVDAQLEKVTDPGRFLDYGLLSTPGLVINGKLVSAGRIPSPDEIIGWIEAASA